MAHLKSFGKKLMKSLVLVLLLLSPVLSRAAVQKFDVHRGVRVAMNLPAGWHAQKPSPSELGGLNIYVEGPKSGVCLPAIVGQVLYRDSGMMDSEDKIAADFAEMSRDIAASSVEKRVEAKKLKLKSGIGFYCPFTDESMVGKAKGDRDAQVATRYVIVLSDSVMVLVTAYTDDKVGEDWRKAKEAMESLEIIAKDA